MFADEEAGVGDELGHCCLKIRCQLLSHRRPERTQPRYLLNHPTSANQRTTITKATSEEEGGGATKDGSIEVDLEQS